MLFIRTGTKSINCNRVCSRSQPILLRRVSTQTDLSKNAKVITALQFALNTSFVLLGRDTALLAKNSLCTNCLSNKQHKQTCPSTKRCQVCSGFLHTTLLDPLKQIKRRTEVLSTENAQKHQPTVSSNNKTAVENTISSQTKSLQNKNSNSRHGQSFNGQNQTNPQRRNLNGSSTNQSFSINQSRDASKNWYEQLQLIPVSFLKGNKAFNTYALIDPRSQCGFVLGAISKYLELPCDSQQSVPLQFLITEVNTTLSKINEPVTITPYKSSEISFELSRAYSTPSLKISAANVFQLNQICDAFNNLRHIHFPYIADGKLGALLGVNAFAFTYHTHVIQGNQHQPFGVKTKLGWH